MAPQKIVVPKSKKSSLNSEKRFSNQFDKIPIPPFPRNSQRISINEFHKIQEVPSGMEVDDDIHTKKEKRRRKFSGIDKFN